MRLTCRLATSGLTWCQEGGQQVLLCCWVLFISLSTTMSTIEQVVDLVVDLVVDPAHHWLGSRGEKHHPDSGSGVSCIHFHRVSVLTTIFNKKNVEFESIMTWSYFWFVLRFHECDYNYCFCSEEKRRLEICGNWNPWKKNCFLYLEKKNLSVFITRLSHSTSLLIWFLANNIVPITYFCYN